MLQETPPKRVKLALLTSRPGGAYDAPGHGTEEVTSMRGQDIPYGYCHCGCGEKTRISPTTSRDKGWVKGEPRRYINGHNNFKHAEEPYEVRALGHETPCWIWTGTVTTSGYGVRVRKNENDGKAQPAHRWMYERRVGPIPDGLQLDHLCRNRACVNPAHVEPVTCAENIRRGLLAKLTAEQVSEIREYRGLVSQRIVAEWYGVTGSAVSSIWRMENWRPEGVPGPARRRAA